MSQRSSELFQSLRRSEKRAPRRIVPKPISAADSTNDGPLEVGHRTLQPAATQEPETSTPAPPLSSSAPKPASSEGDKVVRNPIVFQCASCGAILGDSYSLVGFDRDLGVVALSRTRGTEISPEKLVDEENGCSYQLVGCAGCTSTVGKVFRSTNASLDVLRNQYSLARDCVRSYQLGTASQRPMEEALSGGLAGLPEQVLSLSERILALESDRKSLRDELGKAQNLILTFFRFPPGSVTSPIPRNLASSSAAPRVFSTLGQKRPPPTTTTPQTAPPAAQRRRTQRIDRTSPSPSPKSGRRSASLLSLQHPKQ